MNQQPIFKRPPRILACITGALLLLPSVVALAVESPESAIAGRIVDQSGKGVAGKACQD